LGCSHSPAGVSFALVGNLSQCLLLVFKSDTSVVVVAVAVVICFWSSVIGVVVHNPIGPLGLFSFNLLHNFIGPFGYSSKLCWAFFFHMFFGPFVGPPSFLHSVGNSFIFFLPVTNLLADGDKKVALGKVQFTDFSFCIQYTHIPLPHCRRRRMLMMSPSWMTAWTYKCL
jgi:hypothetical protein